MNKYNKKAFTPVKCNQRLLFSKTENFTGFTLIELLIVIGIIAILASAVIVAINPGQQFAAARDAARSQHINSLYNSLISYQISNQGSWGDLSAEIDDTLTEICNTNLDNPDCTDLADLSDLVASGYINQIPVDPQATGDGTDYWIKEGSVVLVAKGAETRFIGIGTTQSEQESSGEPDPEDMEWAYTDCTDFDSTGGFSGGDGSEGSPYQIETLHQLQAMKCDLTANYALENDIDASGTEYWNDGAGWDPVGDDNNEFGGCFDGQGKTVEGLYANRPTEDFVGFFGASSANISSLNLANVYIEGGDNVGVVSGRSRSGMVDIYKIKTSGKIKGGSCVGGIIGEVYSVISNSASAVLISGSGEVGGIGGCTIDPPSGITLKNSIFFGDFTEETINNADYLNSAVGSTVTTYAVFEKSYYNPDYGSIIGELTFRTTNQLQTPTAPDTTVDGDTVYEGWDDTIWNFGSDSEYPTLKVFE